MTDSQIDFEISFFEKLAKRDPNFIAALIPLAEAYTKKGLHEKALPIDQRLTKLCPEDPAAHYNLACSLALIGRKEEALQALEGAVVLGYDDFKHLRQDPDLKSLHSEPRFQSLLLTKK